MDNVFKNIMAGICTILSFLFGDIEGIRRKTAIDDYLLFTERFEGENLKEKVTSMLINNGVEESDINNFISIMTESSYLL